MLARGVDATPAVRAVISPSGSTCRRSNVVQHSTTFAAAAPLRSLPHLLGWTLDALPSPGALRATAQASTRIRRSSPTDLPPADVDVERRARARRGVPHDRRRRRLAPVHLAARPGLPTIILLPSGADWLSGPQPGPSPWYLSAEVPCRLVMQRRWSRVSSSPEPSTPACAGRPCTASG